MTPHRVVHVPFLGKSNSPKDKWALSTPDPYGVLPSFMEASNLPPPPAGEVHRLRLESKI